MDPSPVSPVPEEKTDGAPEVLKRITSPKFAVGQFVMWYLGNSMVTGVEESEDENRYYQLRTINFGLTSQASEEQLTAAQVPTISLQTPLSTRIAESDCDG